MWYLYLLYSKEKNVKYVGSTDDLKRRVEDHLKGKSAYTKMTKDWTLIYYKEYTFEKDVRDAERRIKRNKKYRKLFYEEAGIGSDNKLFSERSSIG